MPGSFTGRVIVQPMIGDWQVPRLTGIETVESRRVAVLPVPGLAGDLQQDLGADALTVEMTGSLHGDEARDTFLEELRERFRAGEPVPFVADITTATELEEVMIIGLDVREVADSADTFFYRITLREYVEPPAPPLPFDDLGADFLDDLSDLAGDLLDGLDLPDLLGVLPDISDPTPLVMPALDAVADVVAGVPDLLGGLSTALLGDS